MAVLSVRDLKVAFGSTEILRGVSFELEAGRTLGVVGESGCGKTMTGLSIMGMLPGRGRVYSGSIQLDGKELTSLEEREWRNIRGQDIAMVMQDPFTSLNPMMRVGDQIAEVLILHRNMGKADARKEAVKMLEKVGVPAPESAAFKYPHQLSGGQRQRIVIAIAFSCEPKVLIADEPTTALDVTLQAQILRLIKELQSDVGTAVMLISHDIGVIGSIADRIAVFYAGKVVEIGPAEDVLRRPQHPYTSALLSAIPHPDKDRLEAIGGQPPDLSNLPTGCSFGPRCPFVYDACDKEPELVGVESEHTAACWKLSAPAATS